MATPRRARRHLHGTLLARAAVLGSLVIGAAVADDVGATREADAERTVRTATGSASPVAAADPPPLDLPAALRVTRSGERSPIPKATEQAKPRSAKTKPAKAIGRKSAGGTEGQDEVGTSATPVPAPPPEWNTAVREFGAALQYAWELTGSTEGGWHKLCQRFVRTALGLPATAESAAVSWEETPEEFKHTGPPPAGVPVYWSPNHVALSAGYGYVYSNDIRRKGKIDIVPIERIEQKWGLTLLGWSSWMNGFELEPEPDLPRSIGTAVSTKR